MPAPTGLTARWAEYAATVTFDRLPTEVVETVKALMLDTIGVALAATTLGEGYAAVSAMIRADPGVPEASLFGAARRVSVRNAAFGNGALAHALNFDANGAAGGHLALAAIPAPLAMAERCDASGRDLITAIALGAELTARLAAALSMAGVDANERFLEGQLLGYFGAALACGRLLRLSASELHAAMGLALMQAAGSRQISFEGRPAKAIYGAYPSQGGAQAALLAMHGLDARAAAIEGPAGLYALAYGGRYDAATITAGLGERYRATEVVFKRWPTSEMLHPPIVACQALRGQGTDWRAIEHVDLRVGPHAAKWLEPAAERRHPRDAATAANSLYFGVAKALVQGTVALADFTSQGLDDPSSAALADRIVGTVDASIGAGAEVTIRMRDGRTLSASAPAEQPRLGFDDLLPKFRECISHAATPLSSPEVDRVIEVVARLESLASVRELTRMLTPTQA